MKRKSREYTKDEVIEKFLMHIWMMIDVWDDTPKHTTKEKMSGLVHSILATIDGEAAGLPAFNLEPMPHPNDKEFQKDHGENWFPRKCQMAGGLHTRLYEVGEKYEMKKEKDVVSGASMEELPLMMGTLKFQASKNILSRRLKTETRG